MNIVEAERRIKQIQDQGLFQPYSSMELEFKMHLGTSYDNLQMNFANTQDNFDGIPFGSGKNPWLRDIGKDVYNGWRIDRYAPSKFWLSRREKIVSEKAEDEVIYLPMIPDLANIPKHPFAVYQALRLWSSEYNIYGNDFQFVLTTEYLEDRNEARGILVIFKYSDSFLAAR